MTACFSADVTLADARQRLAAAGQWLPIDGDPHSTLGRLVSHNSTGPLRLGYGAWRDLLLGVQFLNGREELITVGGRTVKDVAGYDLTKLVVGQRDTFGRLVTLTTRTYCRPAGSIVVELPPNSQKLHALLPSALRPQWAALTTGALHLGYLGDERTLEFYRERLRTLSPTAMIERSVDEDIEHRRSLWCRFGERTFRASVPPANMQDFVRAAALEMWTGDAAFGIVVGAAPQDALRLADAAKAVGGRCALSDEPPILSPVERAIVDRLREAFGQSHDRLTHDRPTGATSPEG